jgi:group I intron endonuclease
MFGYIYETTNLINGKKYIGKRQSNIFLGNKYLGSGKILKQAIIKEGEENFSVKLLEKCDSKEDLEFKEKYYISKFNAVKDTNYYNIATGGEGGDTFSGLSDKCKEQVRLRHSIASSKLIMSEETKNKISRANKNRVHSAKSRFNMSIGQKKRYSNGNTVWNKGLKNCFSSETLKLMSEHNVGMKGKKHKESTKELMSNNQIGNKNSFYNKHHTKEAKDRIGYYSRNSVWITKDNEHKRVLSEVLNTYLSLGWHKGRH